MILITSMKDSTQFASDIARDPFYRFLEQNFFYIFASSLAIFYVVGGFSFLVWGGFVRLVVVAHSTWAINGNLTITEQRV